MAITESTHAVEGLISEDPGSRSRKNITVNTGQDLGAMTVLGQIYTGTAAAGGSNTGDGTASAVTIGKKTEVGAYPLTATSATSFDVRAPSGYRLPTLTVGSAYTGGGHFGITLSAGSTDFIAGDTFTVTMAEGDWEQLVVAATDGTQKARGILLEACNATSADKTSAAVVRDAKAKSGEMTWPTGITAGQKTTAISELAEFGVIVET